MNRTEVLLTAFWFLLVGNACNADELLQFAPGTIDSSDFGTSVAMNSTHALIGEPREGTVSVYDLQSGDLVSTFSSSEPRDRFGEDLVLTDKYAVVAASNSDVEIQPDEILSDVGRVFVYDASTWQLMYELLPGDLTERGIFGFSVDVYEDTLVVGSPWLSRSAYVFDLNSGDQVHKLKPDQLTTEETFGRSVAVSGNRVVVGAPDYRPKEDGSAYVFDLASGEQIDRLVPTDRPRPDFGEDVAMDEDLLVVGEFPNIGGNINHGRGVVHVFDLAKEETVRLLLPDSEQKQFFGAPLDLSGDNVIIGAHHDADSADNSGSAYVFNARTGLLLQKFVGEEAGDEFGISVDILGDRAIIGAWAAHVDGIGDSAGKAYLFTVPEPSGMFPFCCVITVVWVRKRRKLTGKA